ncbi:InlB B-repeat-containing protein [Streptococcus suis]|nr:LPXTG cell wall anchor domain-containing protein [Streptococcus suis]HEM4262146.1 InlB B-repeat-containing protein [Streptococcus suis]HEM6012631.1 InlB B-repeat-containing protein [Streptococcus suis]HEM6097824.1 InlB B-repeat-containing protein [Streptococcus suis]HEM6110506.1 InlB B-repeat-containing protein [Streptococcus suis]
MQNNFKFKRLSLWQKKYRKFVNFVAVVVVFVTTYALILPALTLESNKASQLSGISSSETTTEIQGNEETPVEVTEAASQMVEETSAIEQTSMTTSVTSTTELSSEPQTTETTKVDQQVITEATEFIHKGKDYEVIARFDASAKMPKGVELKVKEIEAGIDTYKSRFNKAKATLGARALTFARFFDISFVHDGKEIQPEAPISIQIKTDSNIKLKEETKVEAVHFQSANKAEIVPEVETNEENNQVSEISFDADSFSDYGVVGAEYYKVTFVALDSNGQEQTVSSLVDKKEGAKLETLPEEPFRAGYRFIGWRDKETNKIVTADTLVTRDMIVEAEFASISIYKVTIQYFYNNITSGQEVIFETEVYELEAEDMPYRITTPVSTEIKSGAESGLATDAIYYTSRPIIDIQSEDLARLDKEDGNVDNALTIKVAYIPYNSEYKVRYKLKNLDGTGYTDIETGTYYGIIGSTIRPEVRNYSYANFEKTDALELKKSSGQEIDVYYTRKEYTLSYNTNGGSYLPPQTGLYNAKVNLTTTIPTREGYTFDGWYDNANLTGSPISDSVTLDKNKTLYAKWKADTVKYTIAYYKEVYNNSTGQTDYAYEKSVTAQGQVGTIIQASTAPEMSSVPIGYEKETAYGKNSTSSIIVAADGSSTLKVYYSLIRYTFVFDLNNPNGRITMGGRTYSDSNYRITDVVLGKDISRQWPSSISNPKEIYDDTNYGNSWSPRYYSFNSWDNSPDPNYKTKRYEVTEDLIAKADRNTRTRTLKANWTQSTTQASVEYWLQQPDGSYQKSNYYSQSFIRTGSLGAKQIFGYDYLVDGVTPSGYQSSQTARNPYTYRFYYNRKSSEIHYIYKSEVLKTEKGILFDADISSSRYNFEPTQRPSGVDSDYEWKGWYTDSNLTEAYTFDKMPSDKLVLYAKWVAPNMAVSFDLNGGEGTAPETQTVEKKKTATVVADPTRAHYDFDGWFTAKEGGERYVWSKPVTENITLYARWKPQPLKYMVKYVDATTNKSLAADKVIESPALELHQAIKENALAITGYRPDASSKTLDLTYDNNEIIFYYSDRTAKIPYTVRYLLKDGDNDDSNNTVLLPEDHLEADANMIVAKAVAKGVGTGYYPQNNVLSLTLTTNSANNIITFYYLPYEFATLTVNYLDMDGNPIAGQDPLVEYKKKGDTYILNRKEIQGYTFSTSKDNENNVDKSIYRIRRPDKRTINLYYKKNLTLEGQPREKVYDDEPLKLSGIDDLKSGYSTSLASGDRLTAIDFEGSQTDVGSSNAKPKSAVITTADGKNHTDYYEITYLDSSLTVKKRPVTVEIGSQTIEKIYDGKVSTVDYKVNSISDSLYKESDIHYTGSEIEMTQKDVGTYTFALQNKFVNTNDNFEVTFLAKDGNITINPRKLMLTSATKEKAYDGTELTAQEVSMTTPEGASYDGFVQGEGVDFSDFASLTNPGRRTNSFTYKAKEGTKLSNYEITDEFGMLTILEMLNITKTDENWESLAGGKFELTKWDGLNWAQVDGAQEFAITSKDGIRIPVGLEAGRYRLQELAAPDGFIVLDSYIYFSIKENFNEDKTSSFYTVALSDEAGNDASPERATLTKVSGDASHRIQVANEQGRALPSTGGDGQKWFILSGLVLIAISYLMHLFVQRNREKRP